MNLVESDLPETLLDVIPVEIAIQGSLLQVEKKTYLFHSGENADYLYFVIKGDLCINMNNHQNAIFHQFENFLKTPLALLGVDLKNSKINKICHFANHPYLCKGLLLNAAFLSTFLPQIFHSLLGNLFFCTYTACHLDADGFGVFFHFVARAFHLASKYH